MLSKTWSTVFQLKVLKLRSSRLEVFCKKGFLKNFTRFTGKHLCQRLFFKKVVCLRLATLLKKRLWHRCFPMNFAKFLKTSFLKEHLWWLLLKIENTCPYKASLSEANVQTNSLVNAKWKYHKDQSFTSNYFISLKILLQYKSLLQRELTWCTNHPNIHIHRMTFPCEYP